MRVAPPPSADPPGPGERDGDGEADRADCVRIVHLLRQGLALVSHKDRKAVAAALKDVYRALDAAAGEAALAAFEEGPWGRKYPAIGQGWRRAWGEVVPFYAFPAEVRRLLYSKRRLRITLRDC